MSDRPLDMAELAALVRRADGDAHLVPARLLRRVIKHDRGLTGFGFQVPHRKCYVTTRDRLDALAIGAQLGLSAANDGTATVFLMAAPAARELAATPRGELLRNYWRLLFHARVHAAMAGRLGPAGVRKRIAAFGRDRFEEAVAVLRRERMLLPPGDDVHAYEEFAATFLELLRFAPALVGAYFPAIDEPAVVRALLARDVDDVALFEATRLDGAPDPGRETVADGNVAYQDAGPPPRGNVQGLQERIDLAVTRGNAVRAAILALRAGSDEVAERQLRRLAERLWVALGCAGTGADAWCRALAPLLKSAAGGFWPAEARLLYDLQSLCGDAERPASAVDFGGWVRARGRQPLERPLPLFPLVAPVRRLRQAIRHLRASRLRPIDRDRLAAALGDALAAAEERVRDHLRPRVASAWQAVGLHAGSFPEVVARHKLTDELLDRVVSRGFLALGDLRDAIARNGLKMPDLAGPAQWWHGDELLAANGALADRLPGVYRFGEAYLRGLQRISAAAFGTRAGRWVTLNLLVPLGGAFLAVEGPLQIVAELRSLTGSVRGWLTGVAAADHAPEAFPLAPWPTFLAVAAVVWLLLHVPAARRTAARAGRTTVRLARRACIDWPVALWHSPLIQRVWAHPVVRGAWQFAVKPLVPAAVVAVLAHCLDADPAETLAAGTAAFVAASALVNSQLGREAGEIAAEWAARRWRYVSEFVPGFVRWVIGFFKRLLEAIDRGLYAVDEWLRFRAGERRWLRAAKTAGGLTWSAASYVVRFVIVLFVEPQINPVKHFPVVTVSHKLLLPLVPAVTHIFERKLGLHLVTAGTTATALITAIPGVFGFLVWEFTENWRLYRANRAKCLRPAIVGGHGETVPRLLRPGFHSGTLPKLFARLRQAVRRGRWRPARRLRTSLHEVGDAVRTFSERELLEYLRGAPAWAAAPVHVADVAVATNRIRIALGCPGLGPKPLTLALVEESGWLTARVAEPGWLPAASVERRCVLDLALNGFYRTAGVDLVREQVEQAFGPSCPPFDITHAGLTLWPGPLPRATVRYDLAAGGELRPLTGEPEPAERFPVLPDERLLLRRRGLPWDCWTAAWDAVHAGRPFEPVDASVLPVLEGRLP